MGGGHEDDGGSVVGIYYTHVGMVGTEAITMDGPMSWLKSPARYRSSPLAVLLLRDVLVVKTEGGPGGVRAGSVDPPQV